MNLIQALQMYNTLKGSGNPMSLLEQQYGNNPALKQAKEMSQGKSPEELKQVCLNLAKQKGIDPQQVLSILSSLGIKV